MRGSAHPLRLLALTALAVILGCGGGSAPPVDAPESPRGLVADPFHGEVLVVDFATGQTTLEVPVGNLPMDVEVLPGIGGGTPHAYVPSIITTTVVDLDTGTATDGLLDVGAPPSTVVHGLGAGDACMTDAGDVYVCNLVTSNVSHLQGGSFQATIPVSAMPVSIAADDQYVYVACLLDDELQVVSQAGGTVVATVPVGAGPMGVAVDESRGLCYVSNFLSGDVSVVDTTTLLPTADSPLAATDGTTLAAALGVTSAELQAMFNTHHAGLIGGTDPLCDLGGLFATRPAGPQELYLDLLEDFLVAVGQDGSMGAIPFAGLQGISARNETVYVANAFAGTVSIIDHPSSGAPAGLRTFASAVASFGPNAIALW